MSGDASERDDLYRLVEEYASLGPHRTPAAKAVDWFTSRLFDLGARVERVAYEYPHYDVRWDVTVDGDPLASFPLYYEGLGRIRTDDPITGTVDGYAMVAGHAHVDFVGHGREAAVLATTYGPGGRLVVPNRRPVRGSGTHVLVVPGSADLDGRVVVDADARIVSSRAENVVAAFGEGERPLLVATPISGWFACAGERGTGIALALALAPTIAEMCPVVVVGTTGHELDDYGLARLLESRTYAPRAILHLGANVASKSTTRIVRSSITHRAVDAALAAIDATPVPIDKPDDPQRWVGEAREWSHVGAPMLSFSGFTPVFHTPEDLPPEATSPELLAATSAAIFEAARVMVRL
jgi:hypothetical protein